MKVIIITQDEPFYIPVLMGKVLAEYKGIIGVITLPTIPKGFTMLSSVKRLYDVFGLRDFLAYGALFAYHKVADLLSHWKRPSRPYSVRSACRTNSIPVYRLRKVNEPESIKLIKTLAPEVVVSVASPQIFEKEMLNLPKYALNIHAALLPHYKGIMPSFWVLAKGEEKTGITVHYMSEYIDKGNIILQRTISISPQDTLHSLQNKVADVGAMALLEALEKIEKTDVTGTPPNGSGSYYSFPTKEAAREFRARGRRFI